MEFACPFCHVRTQLSMNKGAGRRISINVLIVLYFYFHVTFKCDFKLDYTEFGISKLRTSLI